MMPSQPEIRIEPAQADKMLEITGWAMLVLLWVITLIDYFRLSGAALSGLSVSGWVDNSGSRSALLVLPLTGTILLLGMTVMNRFPHAFSYPVAITAENARDQYTMSTRMIRLMKIAVAAVFTAINLLIFNGKGSGVWILPLALVVFTALAAYYIKAPHKAREIHSLVRKIIAKVHK